MLNERWMALAHAQADRFWSKVNKDGPVVRPELGPCWVWTKSTCKDGYGRFQINEKGYVNGRPVQKHVRAHKLSWEMVNGPLPDDLVIMHACDNPACVRLEHLSAGTQADNRRDCGEKGRNACGDRSGSRTRPDRLCRGERNAKSNITTEQARMVIAMRAAGAGPTRISKELGVSMGTVSGIIYNGAWSHAAHPASSSGGAAA